MATTRSPLTSLICCAAITVGLLVVGGGAVATLYYDMVEIEAMAGRLAHLDGLIVRLDEAQTMAVKMAAATGDPKWEAKYRESDEPLNAALAEALAFAPEAARPAGHDVAVADAALNAMDERAFGLIRQGKLVAAAAVFDATYDEQRRNYTEAVDASMAAISASARARIEAHQRTMVVAACIAVTALVFLALLWLHMLTMIRRYIQARNDAEARLVEARAMLETRVEQRTREVAASREQYRFLVENIDAVPFEWDPATYKLHYIGPQAAKLLGCPPEALRDELLLDKVLHADDRARFRDRIDKFVAGESPCVVDCRMVTVARRTITVRMFLSARGSNQTSYGVMLDVTNQVKQESEAQQAQKLESIGRLAAGIAHEINTPVQFVADSVQFIRDSLTDVMATADLHRRATLEGMAGRSCVELWGAAVAADAEIDLAYLSEQVPLALDRSLDGLSRVATIVRSMKVFAHTDHQRDKTLVNINESIKSTLIIAHSEYKYVADVETELGDVPDVPGYPGDLNQVFLNLLVNASHAIGDVVANTDRRGRITVTTRCDGDHVVIAIGDTGTGIPATVRDRVFDPFFTTKQVGKGTGQGLSHARSVIVDKHQGTLTFETTSSVGTTFYIRLPLNIAAQEQLVA